MIAAQLLLGALLALPALVTASPALTAVGLSPRTVLQERGCTKSKSSDLDLEIIKAACPDGPLPLAESCKFVSQDSTGTDIYKYAFFLGGENCNGGTDDLHVTKSVSVTTGNTFSFGAKVGVSAGVGVESTSITLETNYESTTSKTNSESHDLTVRPGKKSVWVTQTPYKRHFGQIVVHYKDPVNCEKDHSFDAANDQPAGNNNPVVFQHDFGCGDNIQATIDEWNDKGINTNWKAQ